MCHLLTRVAAQMTLRYLLIQQVDVRWTGMPLPLSAQWGSGVQRAMPHVRSCCGFVAVMLRRMRGKSHATVRYWPGMGSVEERRRREEYANIPTLAIGT